MVIFRKNYKDLDIRITDERINHIEVDHPEMSGLINWIEETLLTPDKVILSNTDASVEIYYKFFKKTPVTSKFLSVLVKNNKNDIL